MSGVRGPIMELVQVELLNADGQVIMPLLLRCDRYNPMPMVIMVRDRSFYAVPEHDGVYRYVERD